MGRQRIADGDRAIAALRARVAEHRYPLLAAWQAAWLVPCVIGVLTDRGVNEWDPFVFGGRILLGLHPPAHHFGALHLYAEYPGLQTGPGTLLIAGVTSVLGSTASVVIAAALCFACGLAVLRIGERCTAAPAERVLLVGIVFLPLWGLAFGRYLHIDDALALTCLAGAVARARRPTAQPWATGLLLGLAVSVKPWAVFGLPLLWAGTAGRRLLGAGVFTVVAAAVWLPFLAADRETAHALAHFSLAVRSDAALDVMGLYGPAPGWLRTLQLTAATLAAAVVVARHRPEYVLLVAVAVRLLLDPAAYVYYDAGLLFGCALLDLDDARRPWRTAAALVTLEGSRPVGLHGVAVLVVAAAVGLSTAWEIRPHKRVWGAPAGTPHTMTSER